MPRKVRQLSDTAQGRREAIKIAKNTGLQKAVRREKPETEIQKFQRSLKKAFKL